MATIDSRLQSALDCVSGERVADLALELVRIRSYTGETVEVAEYYAGVLADIGLEVEILRDFPRTPQVVGRLRGAGGGPTLELNGHLDTVPVEHAAPGIWDGRVWGRGATDMKGGVAAEVEAIRALRDAGLRLRGDVLLTAHGLHEAPTGHAEDLAHRMRSGPKGDAALIAEGPADALLVAGLGMGIFEIAVGREGESVHENSAPKGTPNPLLAAARLVGLFEARSAELAKHDLPYTGPESYFVGVLQGGDFYNRVPTTCRIVGTRRYAADRSFEHVASEIDALARQVEAKTGAKVGVTFTKTRDGFRLREGEPLVKALGRAYADATGQALPVRGWRSVADAPVYEKEGGIPATYHSPGGEGAHGDVESVPIDGLVRAAKVYLLTAARFCGY